MPATARSKRPKFQEVGATGLRIWGGRVYEEWLPELTGDRGRKVLREMTEQDPVIGGILFSIEQLVRQVQWTFTPKDDTGPAKDAADFAQSCLNDMQPHWQDTLSEILTMLPYGWSWFEIVYKYRSGPNDDTYLTSKYDDQKIGWKTWGIRAQDTLLYWKTDEQNRVVALQQNPPPDYVVRTVPLNKSLHFRTKARKDNPEGVSVLRSAYRPWYFKKHIEQIEGIGVERDLAGLPVMWVPPELLASNATTEQKQLRDELQKIATGIRRDEQEGVLMPLDYDEQGRERYKLNLISTGGQRQFDTDKIINRYDQRIAMTMMADFVLLGHEQVGSFALSDSKTALFATALGAWLDSIASTITTFEMPRLFKINGIDVNLVPELKHSDIENADLGKLGTYLQSLAAAGMTVFPNPLVEKHLLEQAGLPVPDELPSQTEAMVQQAMEEMGLVDPMGNPIPQDQPPPDGGSSSPASSSSPATLRQKSRTSSQGSAEASGTPMRTPKSFAAVEDIDGPESFANPYHSKQTGRFDFGPMGTTDIIGGDLVRQFGGQAAAIRELHGRGKKAGEIARLLGVRPQAVHGQIAKLRAKAAPQIQGIGHPAAPIVGAGQRPQVARTSHGGVRNAGGGVLGDHGPGHPPAAGAGSINDSDFKQGRIGMTTWLRRGVAIEQGGAVTGAPKAPAVAKGASHKIRSADAYVTNGVLGPLGDRRRDVIGPGAHGKIGEVQGKPGHPHVARDHNNDYIGRANDVNGAKALVVRNYNNVQAAKADVTSHGGLGTTKAVAKVKAGASDAIAHGAGHAHVFAPPVAKVARTKPHPARVVGVHKVVVDGQIIPAKDFAGSTMAGAKVRGQHIGVGQVQTRRGSTGDVAHVAVHPTSHGGAIEVGLGSAGTRQGVQGIQHGPGHIGGKVVGTSHGGEKVLGRAGQVRAAQHGLQHPTSAAAVPGARPAGVKAPLTSHGGEGTTGMRRNVRAGIPPDPNAVLHGPGHVVPKPKSAGGGEIDHAKMDGHIAVVDAVGHGKVTGPISDYSRVGGGHVSEAYKGRINAPAGQHDVIIKPANGEGRMMRVGAISEGNGAGREAAAGVVSMHMENAGLTIGAQRGTVRDTKFGPAFVGGLVGQRDNHGQPTSDQALFDAVIGNGDRHGGNWRSTGDKVYPIDHGLAFPDQKGYLGGQKRFMDEFGGQKLSSSQRSALQSMKANETKVRSDLEPLVGKTATNLTFERVDFMLKHDRIMTSSELANASYTKKDYVSIHQPRAIPFGQAAAQNARMGGGWGAPRNPHQAGRATRARRNQGVMLQKQQKRAMAPAERQALINAQQAMAQNGLPAHAVAAGIRPWARPVMNRRGRIGWWAVNPGGGWKWIDLQPGRH